MKITDLPTITKQQKQTLSHLYKFRYIIVKQFQQLLNHKNHYRIQEWLKDLLTKKYIERIKNSKDVTKPIVYCLAQRARHILKENQEANKNFLLSLYKEKDNGKDFINHHLFILNAYLYFLKNSDRKSELIFFSKHELKGYDYFPDPLPNGYIALKENGNTSRYFLESFDENDPYWLPIQKIRKYIDYSRNGTWQANTENSPFPSILFILPNEKRKTHVFMYGRSKLKKTFEDISLFLTTQDAIRFSKGKINIWKKVE
jgi:hypothetical protein